MKDVCRETGMTYEVLKFCCNEGLVSNVKRGASNHRVFDERVVAWIKSLTCLMNCGMSIQEMKEYIALCLKGEGSIPERKVIPEHKRAQLVKRIAVIQTSIDHIDWKQGCYDDVLAGKTKYISNLVQADEA